MSRALRYDLPNGMYVEYPASDQAYYLSSIMKSIFEYGLHVRRLMIGLSGRNMRRALEIFLEFCTSGHIGEDEFLKIRQSQGQYVLPLALVTTVLLRLNQRYYSSSHAYLKSLYSVDEHDSRINYFSRVLILHHLFNQMNTPSPRKLKGYVRVGLVREFVTRHGVEDAVFTRELESLAHGFCIVTEDFRVSGISDEDLVALGPAGLVHVDMLHNIYYLAAVAEDTWFFQKDAAVAIAGRITDAATQYIPSTTYYNALAMVEMISASRERERSALSSFVDTKDFDTATDLTKSWNSISFFERSIVPPAWQGARDKFKPGETYVGVVSNVVKFGVFVALANGISGLIPSKNLPIDFRNLSKFKRGEEISVEIVDVDFVAARMSLSVVENDL